MATSHRQAEAKQGLNPVAQGFQSLLDPSLMLESIKCLAERILLASGTFQSHPHLAFAEAKAVQMTLLKFKWHLEIWC